MKLLRSAWMQELDGEAIDVIGIPSIVLMENASQGAAAYFARRFSRENGCRNALIVAGKGNNGGDGIAVGRILHQQGYHVDFLLFAGPGSMNPDPAINFQIIKNLGLDYAVLRDEAHLDEWFEGIRGRYHSSDTFIVDAIFGTGLTKPVKKGLYSRAIQHINQSGFPVAAVDLPSGLSDAFLPEEGIHVNADITATFQCLKTAHLHPDGNKFSGDIEIIDIGIPRERVNRDAYYIDIITPGAFKPLLAKRSPDAHKGDFGHGLTVAGSPEKPGAGILSSYALLRSGAGLCTAAAPYEHRLAIITAHPELMTLIYTGKEDLRPKLKAFDVVLAGPGMANDAGTLELVKMLIAETDLPLVLDADALNVLQGDPALLSRPRTAPLVITPHPGEFSRLTGLKVSDIRRDRIGAARDFAVKHGVYVVLKGHHTLIATPEGRVYVNPTGNPGMATAGSGDVLSGLITGLMCQFLNRYTPDVILQAAVFIHGCAGDLAVQKTGQAGLTAGDINDFIPRAFLDVETNDHPAPFEFS